MTMKAPRRPVRTYAEVRTGEERYVDTGRPVEERLGSHVVLWIIEDPEAWATAIEADGDAELTRWPKKDRPLAEYRRAKAYEAAAQVRAGGAVRSFYSHHHSAERAAACVAELRRSHPNPGVRYRVAEITDVGACRRCHQPMIKADGQWRHHGGRYPAECRRKSTTEAAEEERRPGEWEIDVGRGRMICGYCDLTQTWPTALLGYEQLTGFWTLGIEEATGRLVVLAEAKTLSDELTFLPHSCSEIPADVRAKYPEPPGGERPQLIQTPTRGQQ